MAINIPEKIYKIVDLVTVPVIYSMISKEDVSRRLKKEQGYFSIDNIEYTIKQFGLIHDRAASMVSHLSLMLALCLFLLQSKQLVSQTLGHWIVIADTLIYISLVILSVRCLRSFGLERDYPEKELYEKCLHEELTLKFCIMQILNSFTIVATAALVLALILSFKIT